MLSTPFSHDSTTSRILEDAREQYDIASRRLNEMAWGDSEYQQTVPTEIRDGQVHIPSFEVPAPYPDHYCVRGGLCACGFESAFTGDMDRHIEVRPYPPPRGPLHDQVVVDEAALSDNSVLVMQGGRVAGRIDNLGDPDA